MTSFIKCVKNNCHIMNLFARSFENNTCFQREHCEAGQHTGLGACSLHVSKGFWSHNRLLANPWGLGPQKTHYVDN